MMSLHVLLCVVLCVVRGGSAALSSETLFWAVAGEEEGIEYEEVVLTNITIITIIELI